MWLQSSDVEAFANELFQQKRRGFTVKASETVAKSKGKKESFQMLQLQFSAFFDTNNFVTW